MEKIQCVILAGGLGTRMKSFTDKIPKALIPVLDRPFADYQLTWLAQHGVSEVLYSVGYKGEMIRDHVGDGSRWGLKVNYVDEGKDLRGTAGALRFALDQGMLQDQFLMTYGDSFLPIDFKKVWTTFLDSRSPALMSVFHNEGKWDTSNVIYESGRIRLYDKFRKSPDSPRMRHIDYGLLAFRKSLIAERIPSLQKMDLADLLHPLSLEGRLAGYEAEKRFYEIGSPSGLADMEDWIRIEGMEFYRALPHA